ncbi:MAG: sulfite exporter TauE/SafE family protein [Propionibacteriaceae bacterium]|nr:sulfite exporter TauE/SafE family protein [Propionibacteriaceae bacterium]
MSLIWVAPLALVVGLSLGALGGGGAILTVPILVYLLHQPPSAATTGSLVIIGLTSLVGIAGHWASGNVKLKQGVIFGAAGVVGSLAGSRLSMLAPPEVLMTMFGLLMLVVAAVMLRQRAKKQDPQAGARPRGLGVLLLTATAVGLLTGFFGVGGGFAVVPALVLALGFSMPAAVATSLVVIAINSATALAARAASGLEIDWLVIGVFSVLGAIGSVLGARIAQRVAPRHLNLAFSVLVFAVAGWVLVMNVPVLLA